MELTLADGAEVLACGDPSLALVVRPQRRCAP
jgi:hypothetical protein